MTKLLTNAAIVTEREEMWTDGVDWLCGHEDDSDHHNLEDYNDDGDYVDDDTTGSDVVCCHCCDEVTDQDGGREAGNDEKTR